MAPTTLFVDTSILRGIGFNFRSRSADALVEIAQRHKLKLLLPEITEKEVKRQIKALASDIAASLKASRKKAFMLDRHKPWVFSFGDKESVTEEINTFLSADWTSFLGSFQVERLPYSDIDLNQTLSWWESYEAPFSIKKPTEFADAFAASCLLKYQLSSKSPIAVLSSDSDWGKFCETREEFVFFDTPLSYAEALDPNVESILLIKLAVDRSHLVADKIKSLISASSFDITLGWDAKVHDVKIPGLKFSSLSVLISSLDRAEVAFCVSASVEMDLEYTDVVVDGRILSAPEQFREQYHSGIDVCGALSVQIDPDKAVVSELLHVELDKTDLSFPYPRTYGET